MNNSSRSRQPYQAVILDPSTGLATVKTLVCDSEMQAREWACSLAQTSPVQLWYSATLV